MSALIEVKNLSKSYNSFVAVNKLNFSLKKGEVLGFLGPNGAGKTTTMRLLTGFLKPSEGIILVKKENIHNNINIAREAIGYVPEGSPLYNEMNTIDFLNFIYNARFLPRQFKDSRIKKVISLLKLNEVLEQKIDTLSKGFKRRLGLAQAVIHDPEILILDEPTDGLDPNQKNEVRNLIKNLGKQKAIIISTHILEEVNTVCNRAMIISNGKLLLDDSPSNILKKSKFYNNIVLSIEEKNNLDLKNELLNSGISKKIYIHNDKCVIESIGKKKLKIALQNYIKDRQYTIKHFSTEKGKLEDVFRELTKNE